ncbi:MAG: hypothetical protein A2X86_12570 [Bdellovibrionales bacterium GWA2_49_15]|nr:MAG: hypothetical protein A2X86_12570 [Bdellovibrionales bacterium GWA2_49_15]
MMMKPLLCGIILVVLTSSFATELESSHAKEIHHFDHNHSSWTSILKKYISSQEHGTQMAYGKLVNSSSEFELYLKELESVTQSSFHVFNREEQLAFLINAYNAFTVKLILDHYPVKSIKEIGSLFSSPWKKHFFTLLGAKRNLDNIEQGLIRQDVKAVQELEPSLRSRLKKFNDPRIHFAVNCASKSCPALRREAYIAKRLNEQLEDATYGFLNNSSSNRFIVDSSELHLSTIFKWYGADFKNGESSVQSFVAARMGRTPDEKKVIREANISYLDYDWSLNGE